MLASFMNVITKGTLLSYIQKYPKAKDWLITWYETAESADWENFNQVKKCYPSAGQVGDNSMVFNVNGNNYRLIVRFSFVYKSIQIKWFGPHKEYDKIDVLNIQAPKK